MELKKILSLFLVAVLALSMVAGCGETVTTDGEATSITYWVRNDAGSCGIKSYDEMLGLQEIQKNTGVDIEFIHPVSGQENEQFNVMIASGDYTDVIEYDWNVYQGGILAAVKDGVILNADQFMNKETMPNYTKFIKDREDVFKAVKCSDGTTNIFPHIYDTPTLNPFIGPTIRKDWLDKLGLEIPETIGDWYTVLKAFKEQDPNGNGIADEIPLTDHSGCNFWMFAAAYGVASSVYLDDNGKVQFGTITDDFKEFLMEMNKWYNEGLIDREYGAQAEKNVDYKMTNDIAGAYIGFSGSQMGKYISACQDKEGYKLVATPWPKRDENSPAYGGYTGLLQDVTANRGAAITSANKSVDATVKLFDYLYGEEGANFRNWGIEGESYTVENGEYQYTDAILYDTTGKDPTAMLASYAAPLWGFLPGLTIRDAYDKMSRSYDEQKEAAAVWADCDTSRMLPTAAFSAEEMEIINLNFTNVLTCNGEWISKFIMGLESFDKWDEFIAEMETMGTQKVVDVYQAAYDRYVSF